MNIFDVLFLALALSALITLGTAVTFALSRRGMRSLRILRRLAIFTTLYFAIVIFVSLVSPRRSYNLGDSQCFDDWCIAVTSYSSSHADAGQEYAVHLHISSRARRISQRERNIAVYLIDRDNHRYDPEARRSDVSIGTLLLPGESVELTLLFRIPDAARDLNLVIAHEGGFPIGWFIIGYDSWFRKPPLIRLNQAVPL
jgi:hypothetical protein